MHVSPSLWLAGVARPLPSSEWLRDEEIEFSLVLWRFNERGGYVLSVLGSSRCMCVCVCVHVKGRVYVRIVWRFAR